MPIHIYNPPAPHADPVNSGIQQMGQRCGNCICVARRQLLICAPIQPPYDTSYAAMGGKHILQRNIATAWQDPNAFCQWVASVQLDPLHQPTLFGYWRLTYQQGLGYWQAWADMTANLPNDAVFYQPNAVSAQPRSPEGDHWVQDNWKCLGPNTMPIADGGLGFPATIIVQPFWA